jgi:hypothetical protein
LNRVSACGFHIVLIIPRRPAPPAGRDATVKGVSFKLIQRIREEFEEFPGLRVSVTEAARFWGLDLSTCEAILKELLAIGFLTRGADHRYWPLQQS